MKCCLFQFSKYQNCYCQNSHSSLGKYCYCPYVVCNGKRWTNSILLFLKKIWEWRQILWGKLWWTFFFFVEFFNLSCCRKKRGFPMWNIMTTYRQDCPVLSFIFLVLHRSTWKCSKFLVLAQLWKLEVSYFFYSFFVCLWWFGVFFFVIPICVNYSSASLNLCVSAQCCWRLFVLFEQAFVFVGLEHKGWHKGSPLKEALFWFWF